MTGHIRKTKKVTPFSDVTFILAGYKGQLSNQLVDDLSKIQSFIGEMQFKIR